MVNKEIYKPLSTCWLTINRDCNIRCSFCYAQNKEFDKRDTMSFEMAKALIDIAVSSGVTSFFVLGGEPSIHHDFVEILEYILSKRVKVIVVTNGIKFQHEDFCKRVSEINKENLITIAISLKGASNQEYKELCGVAAYDKVRKAVDNCRKFNIRVNYAYVITSDNVRNLESFVRKLQDDGLNETISFSYCHDVIIDDKFEILDKMHPIEIDSIFAEQYESIDRMLASNLGFHQTLPLCMCNRGMFNLMVQRKQITTACQLLKKNSVIFDTDGGILLCNHLNYSIGKYQKDFVDYESFMQFWHSAEVENIYKKITTMPSEDCLSCSERHLCGGGCCIEWFASSFDSYKNNLLIIKNRKK